MFVFCKDEYFIATAKECVKLLQIVCEYIRYITKSNFSLSHIVHGNFKFGV